MPIAQTPKTKIYSEGSSCLYHFDNNGTSSPKPMRPILLVPSLINRWYILDLRTGFSLTEALVNAGMDVYCLDWGIAEDEDRYLEWDELFRRFDRAVRRIQRSTQNSQIGVLGYCMGGTLCGIYTALYPEKVAALINLAGPIDFDNAGTLAELVDSEHFDVDAICRAGNVNPFQMQQGFIALRPTLQLSKWLTFIDRSDDPAFREAFEALDTWSNDNIPFPANAYRTYIKELYQDNRLVSGTHRVNGQPVKLEKIRCPVLTITADRDNICPPSSATALNENCGSSDNEVLKLKGGHVGTVVGKNAPNKLYPAIVDWLTNRL